MPSLKITFGDSNGEIPTGNTTNGRKKRRNVRSKEITPVSYQLNRSPWKS